MKTPLVSVIIPNYNYGRFLGGAIESVLGQTYPRVEIVVVDDGSTDDSDAVRRRYEGRVRWLTQQRQGVSAARNHGVAASRGELVAFLDADDAWKPTKLAQQVTRWGADPALGLVHCGEIVTDANGRLVRTDLEGGEGWVAEELLRYRRIVVRGPGSTALVPRRVFDEIGGFDPRLTTFADWDFAYRIASRYQVGFVPAPLVVIRSHGGSLQRNVLAMEHDMLLAYQKAFEGAGPSLRRLRRPCFGRLHMVLAGSFWVTRHPARAVPHLLKGLWLAPRSAGRVLGYPLRWWQRRSVAMANTAHVSMGSRGA